MARGGERQPAAERKVEPFRLAPSFENKRTEACAGEAFARGPQRVFDMRGAEEKHARRIHSKLQQARGGNVSRFERGEVLPDPEQRFVGGNSGGQSERKARRRRLMAGLPGKHFVQSAAADAAPQRRIGCRVA